NVPRADQGVQACGLACTVSLEDTGDFDNTVPLDIKPSGFQIDKDELCHACFRLLGSYRESKLCWLQMARDMRYPRGFDKHNPDSHAQPVFLRGPPQPGPMRQTQEATNNLLDPIAQRWSFLVLFTKRTFGTYSGQRVCRRHRGHVVVCQVVY